MGFKNRLKNLFKSNKTDDEEFQNDLNKEDNKIEDDFKQDYNSSNLKDNLNEESPFDEIKYSSHKPHKREWKRVNIFIGGTLQDLDFEREYLLKEVFPELQLWGNYRKIDITPLDLKWGVIEEDACNPNAIGKCLRKIDKCRPFYMCFLGQRRDWIPDFEHDISQETFDEFTDLRYAEGMSATEIEIAHALNPFKRNINEQIHTGLPAKHCLFFFRDYSYLNDLPDDQRLIYTNACEGSDDIIRLADAKLEDTKNRIRQQKQLEDAKPHDDETKTNILITEYEGYWDNELYSLNPYHPANNEFDHYKELGRLTNFKAYGKPLKDVIIEQLKEQIMMEFPESMMMVEPETELEYELEQQDNFCHLNSKGHISNPHMVIKLKEYVEDYDNDNICLVSAEAGYGKTMLLSKFASDIDEYYPEKRVFKRFCGITNLSSNIYLLWKSIIDEAGISEYEYYYPKNIHELKRNISLILEAFATEGDCIIIIDSITQSSEGINMLRWFDKLPKGLKLIISIKEDRTDEKFDSHLKKIKNQYNICSFEMRELDYEDKKKIINEGLEDSLTTLSDEDIELICTAPGSANPIYLKILINEIVSFKYFDIEEDIKKIGDSPSTAFSSVLERLEKEEEFYFNRENIVKLIFSLISCSRKGLLESELVKIIHDETRLDETEIRVAVNQNLREVMPFMKIVEGRYNFFYEKFKEVTEIRYSKTYFHNCELLINHFKSQIDHDYPFNDVFNEKSMAYTELPHYLYEIGKDDELHNLLTSFEFIKNKLELSDINTLIEDYYYLYPESSTICLINNALELSAPILKENKDQLSAQLWARLYGTDDVIIQNLLDEIESQTDGLWLKSHSPDLYSGQRITKFIPDGEKSTTSIVILYDETVLIGTEDGKLSTFGVAYNESNILEDYTSKIIKIISNNDDTILVANAKGNIELWDIKNKFIVKEYPKINAEITDIFLSEAHNKIYASSHNGIFSIDLVTDDLRKEPIESKNYNQILIEKSNNTLLLCNENEVECYDLGEMRKLYAKIYHYEEDYEKIFSSDDIEFIGINDKFSIFISEDGRMKFWNSTNEELIDEVYVCSPHDKFTYAKILEHENQIITISDMGILRVWDFPQPTRPKFRIAENNENTPMDIQTDIKSPTTVEFYDNALLIGNVNNEVNVIDLNKISNEYYETRHSESVLSIETDGNMMMTISNNGELITWNLDNEQSINRFLVDFRCYSVSYNAKDSKLFLAGIKPQKEGRKVYKMAVCDVTKDMWETMSTDEYFIELDVDERLSCEEIIEITQNHSGIVFIEENKLNINGDETPLYNVATTLATEYDSDEVFVGFEDGSIIKYPIESVFDSKNESPVTKIKVADDKLIAGYKNGMIEIFTLDGNHLTSLEGHKSTITDINVIDECLMASVSADSTFKFWDIDKRQCIYTYFLEIYATAINIIGNKVMIGDALGNIKFYEY